MLAPSELQQFFPVVMTPSHDGKFFQNYVASMLNFTVQSERTGMRMQVLMHQGESLVTRARNNCVAQFLANPQWTHLFWIDADIGFSAQAAFRLLLSGYDELRIQPDGFMEMTEAPTGFMAIKRSVFERLIASYPDLSYVPDSIGEADLGLHYRFFDVMVDPVTRRYLSEDYGFCRLWSGLGESVYIDANSNLTHQGAKLYRGDFASSLLASLPHAVGGPAGAAMVLTGQEYLNPNPPAL
ncbi:hypothetical protein [Variovorax sp. Root434]|uniref:hypothetical protein n=1 Tax=Variovorax sp. Root434 TaxID=1736536 RepID=UPI0007022C5D|nr:hypothetical protein [Variovorax sp. Root434]KQX39446.1 hypothetical protein ASD05_01885 [Variovorax sp. Root434]